jgi:phosphate transport system substrate-binding protein
MTTTRTSIAGTIVVALAAVTLAAGCGGSTGASGTNAGVAGAQASRSSTLVGAGSTLVAPLVAAWQQRYKHAHDVTIDYGAIGSGGGIAQISARTVDFGASDAPLTASQKASCRGCVMVPWALAATTVAYNVPGATGRLRLTGPVVADMYLGKITSWNDSAIAKLNPGVKLPATGIHPVYRSDPSGDTFAFTDYLSRVSPAFRAKVGGASTEVSWPTGSGAKGNAGVAATVLSTPGAVAYVAIGQAVGSHLHYAEIENAAHAFVTPSTGSIAAAGKTARFRSDNSVSIVDPPSAAKPAYPISTFTYAIVSTSSSKLSTLKQFLRYAVTGGQGDATRLEFAPLPRNVVTKDESIVAGL